MTRPLFVGRAHEIAQAFAIVREPRGATLAIHGPPGIGKTALLGALRTRLEAAGLVVERVVASTSGLDLPLAPFSRFLEAPAPAPPDLAASVAYVVNALRAAARQLPTVLMVDDAHGLDDASAVVVSQLAHGDEVRVVLVARSSELLPADLEHLLDDPGTETIEVRPLTRDETDELVRRDLGRRELRASGVGPAPAEVSAQVLDRMWAWSEGVPFHVRDLLDSSVDSGALARADDDGWVQIHELAPSTKFADALCRRVEQLGTACEQLVGMLAVAGPLPCHLVDSILTPEQRRSAERAGIIGRPSQDPTRETVAFAHDLYREAASSWLDPDERRRIAAATAGLLGALPSPSADEQLLHAEVALQAGELGVGDAAVYERGAEVACRRHYDGIRGLRLADAALDRGAGVRAELLRLAALGLLRRFDEASRGYADLAARVEGARETAMVSSSYGWHLLWNLGDVEGAVDALDRGASRVPSSVAEELHGQRVTAQFFGRRAADAVAAGSQWLEDPSRVPPPVASGLVRALAVTGRAEDALRLAEYVLRRPPVDDVDGFVDINTVWNRLLARWQLGRLDELTGPFDGLPPKEHPLMSTTWMRSSMAASFAFLRGHLARSSALHETVWHSLVLGPPQVVAMNTVVHATVQAQLGRPERATELMATLDELPPGTTAPHRWWIARARVLTLAAGGALTDAVRASIELADAHAGEHLHVTTSLHDVVRFGRAKFVEERLAEQARRPYATWWDRTCAEHAAIAAQDEPDVVRLLEIADRFERGGRALDALEATAQAMSASDDVSAPHSSKVLGIAAVSRLDALLDACGPVRTPLMVTVPRSLTEREYLVARLAASGRTNPEIAERLGTSARTVGNQLQSVYQKLGLHSRQDLRFLAE